MRVCVCGAKMRFVCVICRVYVKRERERIRVISREGVWLEVLYEQG